MAYNPIAIDAVKRPLKWNRLIRPGTWIERHRRQERLEIKIEARRTKTTESRQKVRDHVRSAASCYLSDNTLTRRQTKIIGNCRNRFYSESPQFVTSRAAEIGHVKYPISWLRCRAAIPVFAGDGSVAVCFRFDAWRSRASKTYPLLLESPLNPIEPPFGFGLYVGPAKEFRPRNAVVIAHVRLVHMDNIDRGKTNASATKDVELDRNVIVVMVLDLTAALHLTHRPISTLSHPSHCPSLADLL